MSFGAVSYAFSSRLGAEDPTIYYAISLSIGAEHTIIFDDFFLILGAGDTKAFSLILKVESNLKSSPPVLPPNDGSICLFGCPGLKRF